MSNQYIAEIRVFGFNFAPVNWAQCAGQVIAIDQNNTLFQIIGSTYGGNGQTTFGLPNLPDLTTVSMGQGLGLMNWQLGEIFGEANHTLLISEVPSHNHVVSAGFAAASSDYVTTPTTSSYAGRGKTGDLYSNTSNNSSLAGASIGLYGSSLPHNNIQPVQVLNFCIALFGVFPPQA